MPNDRFDLTARTCARLAALVALGLSAAGCVTNDTKVASAPPRATGEVSRTAWAMPGRARIAQPASTKTHGQPKNFDGVASYYWQGTHVATGARFEPNGLTAAHRSLPFGTRVRVSDPKTKRSVIVTINDRGPFVQGRVLDLSVGAARALGIEGRGVGRVHAEVM